MLTVTVQAFADELCRPVEEILGQLRDAGIPVAGPESTITPGDKLALLNRLRSKSSVALSLPSGTPHAVPMPEAVAPTGFVTMPVMGLQEMMAWAAADAHIEAPAFVTLERYRAYVGRLTPQNIRLVVDDLKKRRPESFADLGAKPKQDELAEYLYQRREKALHLALFRESCDRLIGDDKKWMLREYDQIVREIPGWNKLPHKKCRELVIERAVATGREWVLEIAIFFELHSGVLYRSASTSNRKNIEETLAAEFPAVGGLRDYAARLFRTLEQTKRDTGIKEVAPVSSESSAATTVPIAVELVQLPPPVTPHDSWAASLHELRLAVAALDELEHPELPERINALSAIVGQLSSTSAAALAELASLSAVSKELEERWGALRELSIAWTEEDAKPAANAIATIDGIPPVDMIDRLDPLIVAAENAIVATGAAWAAIADASVKRDSKRLEAAQQSLSHDQAKLQNAVKLIVECASGDSPSLSAALPPSAIEDQLDTAVATDVYEEPSHEPVKAQVTTPSAEVLVAPASVEVGQAAGPPSAEALSDDGGQLAAERQAESLRQEALAGVSPDAAMSAFAVWIDRDQIGLALALARMYAAKTGSALGGMTDPTLQALALSWAQGRAIVSGQGALTEVAEAVLLEDSAPFWGGDATSRVTLLARLGLVLRSAIFTSYHEAPSQLASMLTGQFGDAGALHQLVELINEPAVRGIALQPVMLRNGLDAGVRAWEARYEELRSLAADWEQKAPFHRIGYETGEKIWAHILSAKADPGEALIAIAAQKGGMRTEQRTALQRKITASLKWFQVDPEKHINDLVTVTTHLRTKGRIPFGGPKNKLLDNYAATESLLRQVFHHLDTHPDRHGRGSEALVSDFSERLHESLTSALSDLNARESLGPLERAAVKACSESIRGLQRELAGEQLPSQDPWPLVWQPVLWSDFAVDCTGAPIEVSTGTDPLEQAEGATALVALVERATLVDWAPPITLVALDSHLVAGRLLPARRLLDLNQGEFPEQEALYHHRVEEERQSLEREINGARRRVALASAVSVIDDAAKRRLESQVELLGAWADKLPLASALDRDEHPPVGDFGAAHAYLAREVTLPLEGHFALLSATLRAEIDRTVPTLQPEVRDQVDRVRKLIDSGDLFVARDFLAMLREGRRLPEDSHRNHSLHEFTDFLGAVASAGLVNPVGLIEKGEFPEAIKRWVKQNEDAVQFLQAWTKLLKPNSEFRRSALRDFLDRLKVPVMDIESTRAESPGEEIFRVRLRPGKTIADVIAGVTFVTPDWGSGSQGEFWVRVLPQGKLDAEAVISNTRYPTSQGDGPGLLLARARLTASDREELAQRSVRGDTRMRTIVIDDLLAAYLAISGGSQLGTLMAIGQTSMRTNPYVNDAALPAEMFYGRQEVLDDLRNRRGAALVYGGRKLGKTSLLKDLELKATLPSEGTYFVYVEAKTQFAPNQRDHQDAAWDAIGRALSERGVKLEIKAGAARSAVPKAIREYLAREENSRHRIVMMIDEADTFVARDEQHENADGFPVIGAMNGLMQETQSRFRFLIAGLHNVQRLITRPNSVLAQFGTPLPIQPFMGTERQAGYNLITQPLAALGFEFESPDLPLLILSRTSFYPSLVQTFCQALLADLLRLGCRRSPSYTITAADVKRVDNSPELAENLGFWFKITLELDKRYMLIALMLAERHYAGGENGQSMSSDELRRMALETSEKAFAPQDAHVVDVLLDELQRLGIVVTESGRHSLRSPIIASAVGLVEQVRSRLEDFDSWLESENFEQDNERVALTGGEFLPMAPERCMTMLRGDSRVTAILGTEWAGASAVVELFKDKRALQRFDVEAKPVRSPGNTATALTQLENDLRNSVSERSAQRIHVVGPDLPWDGRWVNRLVGQSREVLEARNAKIVFIGGLDRLAELWTDDRGYSVNVEGMTLWSEAAIRHAARIRNVMKGFATDAAYKCLMRASGGFNALVMKGLALAKAQKLVVDDDHALADALGVPRDMPALYAALGVPTEIMDVVTELAYEALRPEDVLKRIRASTTDVPPEAHLRRLELSAALALNADGRLQVNSLIELRMP